tara:strand:- start:369 stop:536 length:168 start_codon:yes stop_codon:yes gene_type:complete
MPPQNTPPVQMYVPEGGKAPLSLTASNVKPLLPVDALKMLLARAQADGGRVRVKK